MSMDDRDGSGASQEQNPDSFAARLRNALGGRSGAWLAQKIDVAPQSVNAWLRGDSDPALSRVVAAAQALGVSVQWLATGAEERPASVGQEGGAVSAQAFDDLLFPLLISGLDGMAELLRKRAEARISAPDLERVFDLRKRMEVLADEIGQAHRQDLVRLLAEFEGDRIAAGIAGLEKERPATKSSS